MRLTYNEIEYILDKKIGCEHKSGFFAYGKYEVRVLNNTLKSTLPRHTETDALPKDLALKVVLTLDTNENDFLKKNKGAISKHCLSIKSVS